MKHEQFASHARVEDHHWWFTGRREILRTLLYAIAPPWQGVPVMDLGCGTGGNAGALASDYDLLGLDPSQQAIELARARFPSVRFIQTDDPEVGRSHLQRGGVLLMNDVLEHVADDKTLLDRAIAVVPAGGHLILTVPCDPGLWSRHDSEFGHFRRYHEASLRALWHDAPVEERLLTHFNSRLLPIIAMIRRLSRNHGSDLRIPVGPLNGLLRRIFAGERRAICRAMLKGGHPYARGVSLIAVLRKA